MKSDMKSAMKPDTPKKRLLRIILIGGGLLALLVGYGVFYNLTGYGIPCMLHKVTGLECPGCGLTRAIAAVVRLDLTAAFEFNALWPLYAAYFLWGGISMAVAYVKRGESGYLPGKTWMHAVILSMVILYGILRNLF